MLLDQLPDTCLLDVVDRGAVGPRRIAAVLGLTKQRVDQILAGAGPEFRRLLREQGVEP